MAASPCDQKKRLSLMANGPFDGRSRRSAASVLTGWSGTGSTRGPSAPASPAGLMPKTSRGPDFGVTASASSSPVHCCAAAPDATTSASSAASDTARMESSEVIAALREGYEALNRGDVSAVLDLIDPELRWEEGGRSPEAGNYSGRDSF